MTFFIIHVFFYLFNFLFELLRKSSLTGQERLYLEASTQKIPEESVALDKPWPHPREVYMARMCLKILR